MFMRVRDLLDTIRDRPLLGTGGYLAIAVVLTTLATWSFSEVMVRVIVAANLNAARPGAGGTHAAAVARGEDRDARTRDAVPPRDAGPVREADPAAARPAGAAPRTVVNPGEDPMADFVVDDGDTYRTLCVRLCDGYFWPISFATSGSSLAHDRDQCASSCGSPTRLYIHRLPGGSPDDMQDLTGQPYTKLRTAFQFRTKFDAACKCTAHPWEQEAKDRHRLYALEQAARNGDKQALPQLAAARARVEASKRREEADKKRANAQLVAAGVVSAASATAGGPPPGAPPTKVHAPPPPRVVGRPDGYMGLGGRPGGRSRSDPGGGRLFGGGPSDGGGASGGGGRGGDWRSRAFGGN